MVDESLKAYLLSRHCGLDPQSPDYDDYKTLAEYLLSTQNLDNQENLNKIAVQTIIQTIQTVKILDPACGSGAFPMGILNRMIDILKKLDPNLNLYKTKLDLIENCIYGIDIQTIAIQISKLRFFISLICEQTPNDNPDCNYGILPLPNLESKFIAANTLIGLNKERKDSLDLNDKELSQMKQELWNIRNHKILHASSWQEKVRYRKEDRDLCRKIEDYLIKNAAKPDLDKIEQSRQLIAQYEKEITELPEIWVDDYERQMSFFDNNQTLFKKDINKPKRDDLLRRIETAKAEIAKEERKSQLAGLEAEIEKMTAWNPYDQNTSSPFFDPEWMFGITEGFDIVIGNPPYLMEEKAPKSVFENIPYYQGKMDLWYAFACVGIDLLKENGVLCYIATNKWITNNGASILRNKVIADARIRQLVDFGNYMIFESADIQTMIMMFERNKDDDNYSFDYRKLNGTDLKLQDVIEILTKTSLKATYLNPNIIRDNFKNKYLTFSANDDIFAKISENAICLNKNELSQGVVFPQDSLNRKNQIILGRNFIVGEGIFALTEQEKNNFSFSEKELELIKPYYTTEQIHRYFSEKENKLWLIYTSSNFKDPNSMNNYPKIKAHLDRFKTIITSDNKPYGLHRAREEKFFKGTKIIVIRKSVGNPSFSYCNFDSYVSQTFNIIQTEKCDLKFLVGLLNSKLIAFWLKNKGKMQGDNYQLDAEPLMQIPIKIPENQQPIIDLVDEILSIKQGIAGLIAGHARNDGGVADTSALVAEIDKLVYELYGLTEDEIKIIESI
jgi:hypothetical protein